MQECYQCKEKGDIRDVQPFYLDFGGRYGHVWLHTGKCQNEYHEKIRAKKAAIKNSEVKA